MSPLEIEILLWYHTRPVDFREGDFSAPAVRSAIDRFRDVHGLLQERTEKVSGDFRTYSLTERGEVYVSALMSLPLPVRECKWVIPTVCGAAP